ncbi:DUF6464 family protein [Nostoc sp. CHAB 5844]|nr:DUF6464 family protein [Nostoc sp. CHAB 5844]
MNSRQRRKSRRELARNHQNLPKRPFITINVDASRVGYAMSQVKAELNRAYKTASRTEIRATISKALQDIETIVLSNFRELVSVQRNSSAVCPADTVGCLGDHKCKFNARSPILQCAVNPKGDCGDCQHFES